MSAPRKTPVLCYISDRGSMARGSSGSADLVATLVEKMDAIARAGVDWIQIREKDLSGRAAAELVRESLVRVGSEAAPGTGGTRILVNDRVDIGLAERAGGVHLGEESLPVEEARRLLRTGPASTGALDFLIGVSTHSLGGATVAAASGADYLIFGPVFPTPSKARYGAPQGVARLAEVCAAVKIPVLAIGGITVENAAACVEAGAAGIAAIRLFQDAADPGSVILRLRDQLR